LRTTAPPIFFDTVNPKRAPDRIREGYDYVLIARPGAVERGYGDLKADLEQALARVHQPQSAKGRARKPE